MQVLGQRYSLALPGPWRKVERDGPVPCANQAHRGEGSGLVTQLVCLRLPDPSLQAHPFLTQDLGRPVEALLGALRMLTLGGWGPEGVGAPLVGGRERKEATSGTQAGPPGRAEPDWSLAVHSGAATLWVGAWPWRP